MNNNARSCIIREPTTQWEKWVPMDKKLFHAVQIMNLCILQKVDEMLNDAGVSYWICGGTLLGATRHSGFIPHDDDIDIEVLVSDLEALASMKPDPPLYSGFERDTGMWEGSIVSKLKFFGGEFEVDVFQRPENLPLMRNFPSKDEIFPLDQYKFHNIEVWGPCKDKCGAYLERCYGNDWLETVCVWNHDFNYYHTKAFDPRKVVLPLSEYNRIVSEAGILPPLAETFADETFQNVCKDYGDSFLEDYRKYRSERTWRWNRADAEWRFEQQETSKNRNDGK